MFYALILALIITGSGSCTFGMDPAPIPDNYMIAWKMLLQDGVRYFDYRMIQFLMVSKTHIKLLRDTAECRKAYLTKLLKLEQNNIIWHKYGAMCGYTTFECDGLYARRFYLDQYGYRYQPTTVYYGGKLELPLPHQPRPYFNNRGTFCFYVYSADYFNEKNGIIVKQLWRSSKRSNKLCLCREKCVAHIGGQSVSLAIFLEFPVLLKAFLKSRIVYKKKDDWWTTDCDFMKIYDLEGVTIPKNYRNRKQYFSTATYASFDDLLKEIRKAIVARYTVQSKNS